jgi:toxin HigB-1
MTIRSFVGKRTRLFFTDDECPAKLQAFKDGAARKLDMLDAATSLNDLRSPPGNRLEALRGDRKGAVLYSRQ